MLALIVCLVFGFLSPSLWDGRWWESWSCGAEIEVEEEWVGERRAIGIEGKVERDVRGFLRKYRELTHPPFPHFIFFAQNRW